MEDNFELTEQQEEAVGIQDWVDLKQLDEKDFSLELGVK